MLNYGTISPTATLQTLIGSLTASVPLVALPLAENPRIGRSREELAPELRSFSFLNYVIFYRPIDAGVEIVRVLHGSRDIEGLLDR